MARPALSAARGIDIIDLLAAAPGRGMTLSDIVRETGINVASCHAVLNVLVERGYLLRDARSRSFSLGPVLFAAGQAALGGPSLLGHAEAAARALHDELGLGVLLTAPIGEQIVGIVAATAPGDRPLLRVGARHALIPPTGAPFIAWSDEAEIAQWLARSPDQDAATLTELRRAAQTIRDRGFEVLLRAPSSSGPASELRALATATGGFLHLGPDMILPDTIEAEYSYDAIMIAAPIFDRHGACAYNLCLGPFPDLLSGARVLELADRLLRTCLQVMHADRAK